MPIFNIPVKRLISIFVWALIVVTLVMLYWPMFAWLWDRWMTAPWERSLGTGDGSQYLLFVPIISFFLILFRIKNFEIERDRNSTDGIILVIFGLFVHLVGLFFKISFVSGYSFVIVISGIFFAVLGREKAKKAIFPLAFLLFMIPPPLILLNMIDTRIRIISRSIAAAVAGILPFVNSAAVSSCSVEVVGGVRSNIRSIFIVGMIAALFAHFKQKTIKDKWIIFLISCLVGGLFITGKNIFMYWMAGGGLSGVVYARVFRFFIELILYFLTGVFFKWMNDIYSSHRGVFQYSPRAHP